MATSDELSNEDLDVTVDDDDLVVRATIDRPDQRNALNDNVIDGLSAVLDFADDGPARVVVIRGAEGTFCAGGDIKSMASAVGQGSKAYREGFAGMKQLIEKAVDTAALTVAALQRDPVIGTFIVASIVPALVIAVYVWRSDVTMAQPLDSLAVTFLLGILFASFAAVANTSLEGFFSAFGSIGLVLFFYLVVAPGEETVKLLAVRMYGYRRDEFAAVVDGAVYGAVAGLGFATIENTLYIT
ncbi:MAG: PrsW family glutamic-type intramembrane protease, partial [Natronomonas sp.]